MVTRGGWRANEAIVKGEAEYTGPTQVFFVHHTATGNGYSCAQSASIVRGIQAYQVRSRGWDDVGYNFLVDKCGTVFEGRRGGVGRTVLGAHTVGFNADASSIAVIGNYGGVRVTPRVRTVIAAVAAYKLGAYGNAPNGRVVLTSGGGPRFPKGQRANLWRIAGHRDGGLTACPGNALYAQLPSIRAIAGAAPAGVHVLRIGGTALSARRYFSKGLIQPVWTSSTPTALINRFEIWVDGVLRVATPGAHRTTRLRLTPGSHTLSVRAVHLSGRSTTVSSRVIVDADAPVFAAKPVLALRPGTISSGAVPLQLRWNVGDGVALGSVGLTRPLAINLGTAARSRDVAAPPNRATPFTVRALDRAGNATSATITRTPWVVSEVSAQRRGSWRTLRNGGYLGGTAVAGSTRGASASFTFTGTSAALVFSRGPGAGRVGVFLDGRPQGMVDLRSASSEPRRIAWSRSWAGGGEHTVRVVVEGTPGRPGVALDGLVYLK
ncbi:N-acetylmuramoyl-L-alanine amidase [Actinoplanes sp. LDG1-01]|uniref:N-acetylmuramoyl-L-alanine amidase n=2 Tax=Paractinoplanes lichenicola TaxID=2802976 RepID=A0ABS1VHF2_9ACTN|nr:N-acetylmuramoyl-L-alanine amidase [Actinoplanes lichenicola]